MVPSPPPPPSDTPLAHMEHRRFRRLRVRIPVQLRSGDGERFDHCHITEASCEGIGLTCRGDTLPRGGFVEVLLPLPDRPEREWPRCHAQIIHRRADRLGLWLGDDPRANPVADFLRQRLNEGETTP